MPVVAVKAVSAVTIVCSVIVFTAVWVWPAKAIAISRSTCRLACVRHRSIVYITLPVGWLLVWPVSRKVIVVAVVIPVIAATYRYVAIIVIIIVVGTCSARKISCPAAIVSAVITVGNSAVGVGITVCLCVYNTGRARIATTIYRRAININGCIINLGNTRTSGIINVIYPDIVVTGYSTDIINAGACYITYITVVVSVLYNIGAANNVAHTGTRQIIIVNARTGNVGLRSECPVKIGHVVTTKRYVNINARA